LRLRGAGTRGTSAMRPEAFLRIEADIRRTEALFRQGRRVMAALLAGSALVAAALALRIATGI
jgi:hypothetical protein